MSDLRPLVVGQTEQQADYPGGVRLGELANELHPTPLGVAVDQVVREGLELWPHGLNGPAAEGRAEQFPQPEVVGTFEA